VNQSIQAIYEEVKEQNDNFKEEIENMNQEINELKHNRESL